MKHTIVLIHGISDGSGPYDFDRFWNLLSKKYSDLHGTQFNDYFVKAPIKWDGATDEGEKNIFETCFGGVRETDKHLVSGSLFQTGKALADIRAWRYFSTFLAGDVIAYIDEADNQIRATAWQGLRQYLVNVDGSVKPFHLVGHSLGSVIAYDFVYSMMERGTLYDFANKPTWSQEETDQWRQAFQNLYTMGSPLGLFMMRKKVLWEHDFASLKNPVDNSTIDRRWLNIWDKDDLIAYPLENLFGRVAGRTVEDVEVDTGLIMPWAHTEYWSDEETADAIVRSLPIPSSIIPSEVTTVEPNKFLHS